MIGLPLTGGHAVTALIFGAITAWLGWEVRAYIAEAEMAAFKVDLAAQADDQRQLKAKVEAQQTVTTQQSTQRLDAQAAQRETEVRYVDREVIHYRDRWRTSACRLPAEWLQLQNRALGVADGAVPGPAQL